MRDSKKCSKCESGEILKVPGKRYDSPGGNTIVGGVFGVVYVTRYVCGQCGYTEEWVDEKLDKVKKKYGK